MNLILPEVSKNTNQINELVLLCRAAYSEELKKAEEDAKKRSQEKASEVEAAKKRKEMEDELKSWEEKKAELTAQIKAKQKYIEEQDIL